MYKLLLACLLLASTRLAHADNIGDFDYNSYCPPANCSYNFSLDTSAYGMVDFNPAGDPISLMFETGQPISWWGSGDQFGDKFGYGGVFDMTGPDGLTFTGVVTSGQDCVHGLMSMLWVTFYGQWSNGEYAEGSAFIDQNVQGYYAEVDQQTAPEPSSIILLGTGFLALWGCGRKLMTASRLLTIWNSG